jgi:hypothetical protein
MFKAFPKRFAISLPIGLLLFSIMEICRWGIFVRFANSIWVSPSFVLAPRKQIAGESSLPYSGKASRQ